MKTTAGTASCSGIGPMRCLWKQFEEANKSLHRKLRLPSNRHEQYREMGSRIILREGGVNRVTIATPHNEDALTEIRIYHNGEAYMLCGVRSSFKETPRMPFSPGREVRFILRAVILGWTMERLFAEMYGGE